MTKFLIAGLGSIGRRHLRNLVALGETDIVLLRSHLTTMPEEELSGFPAETDVRAALRQHRPDAVIVATPTALHLQAAIPAAEAGCAILLEKPISHSLDDVRSLENAASRNAARVLVGFQLRFHPCIVMARELLQEGRLGRVLSADVRFGEYLPAWHPWEDYRRGYAARADLGGGVLLTQCHSLDYLPWLIGRPRSVWGLLAKLSDLDVDVEDVAEIGMRFEGGALAGVHLDYAQRPTSHRLEISGTLGTLVVDLAEGTTRHYDAGTETWATDTVPPNWERNDMFAEEMRHFLAVVRGEAQPFCSLADGIRVMELIAAIRASHSSGRLVNLES